MAVSIGRKGQGESLIKLLVVAIIAIIAIALAKSYFREGARTTQKTVSDVYKISTESSLGGLNLLFSTSFASNHSANNFLLLSLT